VNIIDMKGEALRLYKEKAGEDRLDVIFELHDRLAEYSGVTNLDLNTREGQTQFRKYVEYCAEELMEAAGTLKSRDWTKTQLPVDYDHLKEELVDSFGFFVQLLKLAGIGPRELLLLWFQKLLVNKFRGQSSY